MTEYIEVNGTRFPVKDVHRDDVEFRSGSVPETFDLERVYVSEGNVRGDVALPDGGVLELTRRGDELEAIVMVDGVHDFAEELVWLNDENREEIPNHLLKQGLSAAETLDFWATEVQGYAVTEWAENRGTSHQAVSENVRKAREKLPLLRI